MTYNKYMSLKNLAKRLRKFPKPIRNEKGQSFVEFLFLFLLLIGLSYTMVAGFNGRVGQRWTEMVNIIASDNITAPRNDIELN